ncbi:hypothetical protein CXF86_09535 [Shewanella sp. GutCb]|uniref:hypothetical protein n=1 Tax=Shewanella sp. GutCb TaxID=2058315 RepID=UPI000C79AB44|nr:hypothetical protein [Shewanella sp. GutCb]PKG75198.1 hypothetical protein CXF86_09535 [Shewanella sp. GutCb]
MVDSHLGYIGHNTIMPMLLPLHSVVPAIHQRKNTQIADVKKPVALATGCSLSFETHLRKSGA